MSTPITTRVWSAVEKSSKRLLEVSLCVMEKTKRTRGWRVILVLALLLALSGVVHVSAALLDPNTIPKWENTITGPPPVYVETSKNYYEVNVSQFNQTILPPSMGLNTTVYGYGGLAKDAVTGKPLGYVRNSPGPTFEAQKGTPIRVKYINNLTDPHMFAIDPTIMWANPNGMATPVSPFEIFPPGYVDAQNPIPICVHLHGGEVQATSDGGPDAWWTWDGKKGHEYFTASPTDPNAAIFQYPNSQEAATIWYHDHALGMTRLNVVAGHGRVLPHPRQQGQGGEQPPEGQVRGPARHPGPGLQRRRHVQLPRRPDEPGDRTPTGGPSSSATPSW